MYRLLSTAAPTSAFTPSCGREAWQLRPFTVTDARTRPRWPGQTSSSLGSPTTDFFRHPLHPGAEKFYKEAGLLK